MRIGIRRPSRARGWPGLVVRRSPLRRAQRTQQPFNRGSSLLRRPVGLHEDASAYPRLLSVLQPAQGARSGAGQEPSAVGAPGGSEAGPAPDPRVLGASPPPSPRAAGKPQKETTSGSAPAGVTRPTSAPGAGGGRVE